MRALAVCSLIVTLALCACQRSGAPEQDSGAGWTTAWTASPSDAASLLLPAGSLLRQLITVNGDGARLRLRLSNRLGTRAIALTQVTVGRAEGGAALQAGTVRTLRFNGSDAITIEPGASVLSDTLEFPLQTFDRLAITMQLAAAVQELPRHYQALETPYLALGGATADTASGSAFLPLQLEQLNSWYVIDALEVQGGASTRSVVALGDSITDGYVPAVPCAGVLGDPATVGANARYTDFLARRLQFMGLRHLAVVNAGISGNRVNADGLNAQHGPALLSRLEPDVLSLSGARSVILLAGINDLGLQTQPDASALIAGLDTAVRRLQAAGLRTILGTLTPARGFCTGPLDVLGAQTPGVLSGSAAVAEARAQVNDWIRTRSSADDVIDFDACLRDPANPQSLRADYDSGDHLHPNVAGYSAMAHCIDLDTL